MGQMTLLINGKIPARTECPFKDRCPFVTNKTCHHRGIEHTIAFSCGAARAFDLIQRNSVHGHD
jgi:ribosomal protein L32